MHLGREKKKKNKAHAVIPVAQGHALSRFRDGSHFCLHLAAPRARGSLQRRGGCLGPRELAESGSLPFSPKT